MNCTLACQVMDDYLDHRLPPGERKRLEVHLASCPACVDELRGRSALERTLSQAIGTSVQHRVLPTQVGATVVREARASLLRGIRASRARSAVKAVSGLAAVALVLVGLSLLLGRLQLPSNLVPLALFPARPMPPANQRPLAIMPEDPLDSMGFRPMAPSSENLAGLTLMSGQNLIEPQPMYPGDAFTVTLLLRNDLPEPAKSVEVDLEISGPSGRYRFPLALKSPVPAGGESILRVTSDRLAGLCQERYLTSPTAVFGVPGVYHVRITLVSSAVKPEQ